MSSNTDSNFGTISSERGLKEPLIHSEPKKSKAQTSREKKIDKLRYSKHPLERAGPLSSIFFFWINPFMEVGKKGLDQNMLPSVPTKDNVEKNEQDLQEVFKKKPNLFRSIVSMYKWALLKNTILMFITQICFCSLSLLLYLLLIDVADTSMDKDTKTQRYYIWYGTIAGTQLLGSILSNYITMDISRIGTRLRGSIIFGVYQKLLRLSVLNPTEHTEGKIINYVQADCQKVEDAIAKFSQILESIWQVILGYSLCGYLIGWSSIVLVVSFSIFLALTMYLYKYIIKYEIQNMIAKDRKMQLLKNVLKNLKYIKLKCWELYYHAKIFQRRETELSALKKSNFVFSIVFFGNWFNPAAAYLLTMLSMILLNPGNPFDVGRLLAFMKILVTILRGMGNLPICIQFFLEFRVSLKRLNIFLEADELKNDYIERIQQDDNLKALEMEHGNFYWNKMDEKLMAERRERAKKNKKKVRGKIKKLRMLNNNEELMVGGEDRAFSHVMSATESVLSDTQSTATRSINSIARTKRTLARSLREGNAEARIAFQLRDIEFAIEKGQLIMIFGEIGAGKSSLFYSMLGEMSAKFEEPYPKLRVNGSVGFMSQKPWLMAKSVKENIIMDLPFDQKRFDDAVKYSALGDDLKMFAEGENRILAENGENVSGGQRTRIELARMLYQNQDIMFFDDPLSALDANVSNFLMEQTLKGYLKGKTRIIVTHAIHFLKHADVVLLVEAGEILFGGSYEDLKASNYLKQYEVEDSSGLSEPESDTETSTTKDKKKEDKKPQDISNEVRVLQSEEKLDPVLSKFATEDKSQGSLSWSIFHSFIKNTGGYILFIFLFLWIMAGALMQVYASRYVLEWAQNYNKETRYQKFMIYTGLLMVYTLMAAFRFNIALIMGVKYSRRAHSSMVFKILHAQVEEFLEKVAMGRIINRFTKDMEVVDKPLVRVFSQGICNISLIVSDCVSMAYSLDVLISIPLVIYLFVAYFYQRRSMKIKREAVRLESISKSPIISWTAETLKGLPQIRTMNKLSYVTKAMTDLLHGNMVSSMLSVGLDAWFRLRISLLNIFLVQIPSYLYIIYYRTDMDASKVAFFMLISTILTEDILRTLTMLSEIESNLISVERIGFFDSIPNEPNYKSFKKDFEKYRKIDPKINLRSLTMAPTDHLIPEGKVVFENVTARYGEDAEPVLKNLDFETRPGEKIGIVGRTGAGKSSLIKLFVMTLAPSEGRVLVDGKDISKIDLKELRNEVMVVSQDTALFQGLLSENIDPNMTEEQFPQALEVLNDLGIKNKNILEKGMNCKVDADGSNFSQGEKQIICYARTLINKKKLIILDEATANIDVKTEQAIKKIQETQFAESTMFIIAHRLKTVMHCDRIMVLKFGRIVEFDSPEALLANPDGLFRDMYNKMLEGEE